MLKIIEPSSEGFRVLGATYYLMGMSARLRSGRETLDVWVSVVRVRSVGNFGGVFLNVIHDERSAMRRSFCLENSGTVIPPERATVMLRNVEGVNKTAEVLWNTYEDMYFHASGSKEVMDFSVKVVRKWLMSGADTACQFPAYDYIVDQLKKHNRRIKQQL